MIEDAAIRRRTMQAVRGANTTPELIVRKIATRLGYRYRLHGKDLPGRPDLVFRKRSKAVFVHGCFWHGHDCPRGTRVPKNNNEYWVKKIARNRSRDTDNIDQLNALGWRTLVVWECALKDPAAVSNRLSAFLGAPRVAS